MAHILASLRVETMMLADVHPDADGVARQTLTGDDVGTPPVDCRRRHGQKKPAVPYRTATWSRPVGRPIATVCPSTDDTTAVGETLLIGYERPLDEDPGFSDATPRQRPRKQRSTYLQL